MKYLIFAIALLVSGCMKNASSVSWMCEGEPVVGYWASNAGMTVRFSDNCRVAANGRLIEYRVKENKISFSPLDGDPIQPTTCDLTVSGSMMNISCADHTYDSMIGTSFTKQ